VKKKILSSQEIRQTRIIELVQRDGYFRVSQLSEALNVSEITIRRDLITLEKRKLIERTFGGAISSLKRNKEDIYHNRSKLELEIKDSIAREAAKLVEEGDTVFVNAGSTTIHLFRYINKDNVKVVTTNAGCIGQIKNPSVELIVAGGLYRIQSHSFVGGFTSEILNQLNASKAILGVDALSILYGLTAPTRLSVLWVRLSLLRITGKLVWFRIMLRLPWSGSIPLSRMNSWIKSLSIKRKAWGSGLYWLSLYKMP